MEQHKVTPQMVYSLFWELGFLNREKSFCDCNDNFCTNLGCAFLNMRLLTIKALIPFIKYDQNTPRLLRLGMNGHPLREQQNVSFAK